MCDNANADGSSEPSFFLPKITRPSRSIGKYMGSASVSPLFFVFFSMGKTIDCAGYP